MRNGLRSNQQQKGRLTEAEVARMRRLFHECDEDKDGLVRAVRMRTIYQHSSTFST